MNDDVSAYFAAGLPWQRAALDRLRDAILGAILSAEEAMQYGKPHYSLDGEIAVAIHLAKGKVSLLIRNAGSIPAEKGFIRSLGDGSRKVVDGVEGHDVDIDRITAAIQTSRSPH
jgi:hypothetical protein